jgi:hypothetical protein
MEKIMENNLYRIELIMHNNLPNIDTTGMLMTNDGVAFVKIHPIKINAKPKHEITHGCWVWKQLDTDEFETLVCSNCLSPDGARELYHYCPNCGARMDGGNK